MTKKEYAKSFHSYPEALTVKETAEILRVCTKTIYKIINSGELPAVKIGREMRIAKSNIIDYLRQGNCKKSNPTHVDKDETSGNLWTSTETCDIIRLADGGYILKKGWSENGSEKYPRRKRAV
ncbi:MAG: helix-turn-helix domain-containing protein [Ruminiclostridium sp.]|nr:helix-turn-helix domain-containing protein [Ruminiclostridium sp.]